MMYELQNKVVLITGGANGIGAAIVKKLLEENVKHVGFLDVAEDNGISLQNELRAKFDEDKVKFYKCDVTDDNQLFAAFNSIINEHGCIDLVINNAGIMNDSIPTFKKEIEINVTALMTSTFKSLELMRKDEGGRGGTIINVSSSAALCQSPYVPVYQATKSAVLQFGKCFMYPEYYNLTGVRIVTICFGATETDIFLAEKIKSVDGWHTEKLRIDIPNIFKQSIGSAACGLIEAYKRAENGSVWLVADNKPAVDITSTVTEAYNLMQNTFKE